MAHDLKNRVAAAVRVARTKRGLSQVALAEAVGLSMEAVSHIERGASIPSLETFAELVTTLDLDTVKLIGAGRKATRKSRDRARLEAEIAAFVDGLSDRDLERWFAVGKVISSR